MPAKMQNQIIYLKEKLDLSEDNIKQVCNLVLEKFICVLDACICYLKWFHIVSNTCMLTRKQILILIIAPFS